MPNHRPLNDRLARAVTTRANQKGSLTMKAARDCRPTSVRFLTVGRQSFADDPSRGSPSPPDIQEVAGKVHAEATREASGVAEKRRANHKGGLNMKAARDCRPTSVRFLTVGRQSFADDPSRGSPSPPDIQEVAGKVHPAFRTSGGRR
jgi:hypothetical protein